MSATQEKILALLLPNARHAADDEGSHFDFTPSLAEHPKGTVVLIHGVGLDRTLWDFQIPALHRDYNVLRYDILGHGQTPPKPNVISLDSYVEQLERLLDYLQLERVHLVGYSVGGLIAQRFAISHLRRLTTVTFLCSVYRRQASELVAVTERLRQTREHGAQATVKAAIERWFSPEFADRNPTLMKRIRQRLLTTNLDGYVSAYHCFVHGDGEIGNGLTQVTCPALAMTGENDIGSTPEMCERMRHDLPNGQTHIVPHVRHGAPCEAADEVNSVLLEFFSSSKDR